jgi:ribosomal protein S8
MYNAPTNYALADYINNVNFGIIRGMRFVKINKSIIGIRLTKLLYSHGILRTFRIKSDCLYIYYKFDKGRHIITKLTVVSKPSNRVQ